VQASIASRLSFAYAAAGKVDNCERAWQQSRDLLASRQPNRDPEWMYYLTPNHLEPTRRTASSMKPATSPAWPCRD
jgi:hypothetical protein